MKLPLVLLFLISPLLFSQSERSPEWIAEKERAWAIARVEFPKLFSDDATFQTVCRVVTAYDTTAKIQNPALYNNPMKPLIYLRMALASAKEPPKPYLGGNAQIDGWLEQQQSRDEARGDAAQARADAAYDAATARADALAQHQEQMREIQSQAQEIRDQVEQDNQTRWPTGYERR